MKNSFTLVTVSVLGLLAAAGCSTLKGEKSGQDISVNGPTVLNPRTNPSTIELSRSFEPMQTAEVLADVKDFQAPISSVTLKFLHAPLEIPMVNVTGTTWKATLTSAQIKQLAVGGQTTRYEASVIAKDADGQTAASKDNVTVAIKGPQLDQKG